VNRYLLSSIVVLAGLAASDQVLLAQQSESRGAVRIEVTISRVQGGKTISSVPYTLTANTDSRPSSLRMGTQVPIRTSVTTDGKTTSSYNFRDIGTNIDCIVGPMVEGRHRVSMTIEESSLHEQAAATPGVEAPAIRSFRSTNILLLKGGQSEEFTTATDRLTGEVVRASVKLTVLP
jgi:hypothetical protein